MIARGLGGDSARLQTVVFVDSGQTQIQVGGLEQEPVQGRDARPGIAIQQRRCRWTGVQR